MANSEFQSEFFISDVCKQLMSLLVSRMSYLSPMGKTEFSNIVKNMTNSPSEAWLTRSMCKQRHAVASLDMPSLEV